MDLSISRQLEKIFKKKKQSANEKERKNNSGIIQTRPKSVQMNSATKNSDKSHCRTKMAFEF